VWIQHDRLRELEDVLVDEWQLNIGMSIVEVDRALKISARDWQAHTGFEIFRAVTFEIVEQDEEFVISRREHESLGIKSNHYVAGSFHRWDGCSKRFQSCLWRRTNLPKPIQPGARSPYSCTFNPFRSDDLRLICG